MSKGYAYIPGDPYVCCDRCGFDYRMSQTIKEWTGLRVCRKCWEPRHPQEFVKGVPDRRAVRDARPEPPDEFVTTLWARDDGAEGWPGIIADNVEKQYWGDGWFSGWFVVPWFSDGGLYLYCNAVAGEIYRTDAFYAMGGTVTIDLEYSAEPGATVSVQYSTADSGTFTGIWTTYTGPFTAPLANMWLRVWIDLTSAAQVWIEDLSYQVSV